MSQRRKPVSDIVTSPTKMALGVQDSTPTTEASTSTPNHGQPPDFSSQDSEMYDDACDFGQFMLNPCLCMFKAIFDLAKKCTTESTVKYVKKCDEIASSHVQQFIYVLAVFGSWSVVFLKVYPLVSLSRHVANHHKIIGYAVFVFCVGSWRFACGIDPGNITEETMARHDGYPYDDFIYTNKMCPTLKIRKVARSKYDKYSDRHIPRFDHYCGWLDQPIGEENYRWFLWFLFVHVAMCFYGAFMLYILLRGEISDEAGLYLTALVTVLWKHVWIAATFLLMFVMTAVLGGFLGFHLWLVSRGMTTNEYYKWKEIKAWHKDATQTYQSALKSGAIKADGGTSSSRASGMTYHRITAQRGPKAEKDEEKNNNDDIIINPGPMRQNIYNRGIRENFGEVLFPLSMREEPQERPKNL